MSGHSKWATTKHKKAVVDAKRGALFAKLIKNIEVASRAGGPDPTGNPTLADAVAKAKRSSVPNDNIERAVRRGSGLEAGGAQYEAVLYEGYGPGGVGVLVHCLTDNRNRAAMVVRTALSRNGGTLADPGSVAYLFHRRAVVLTTEGHDEDEVLGAVLDAGGEEVSELGDGAYEVLGEPASLLALRSALEEGGIEVESAEVSFVATTSVETSEEEARRVLRLVDALEECDDVSSVVTNLAVSVDPGSLEEGG